MLKKPAGAEKVEVQAKVEAKMRTLGLRSTLLGLSLFHSLRLGKSLSSGCKDMVKHRPGQ